MDYPIKINDNKLQLMLPIVIIELEFSGSLRGAENEL